MKKFFCRFFESEFGEKEKFISLENSSSFVSLFRYAQNLILNKIQFRENRSYMIANSVSFNQTVKFNSFSLLKF